MHVTLYRIGDIADRYAVLNTLRLVTVHALDGATMNWRISTAQFRSEMLLAQISITYTTGDSHTITVKYANATTETQTVSIASGASIDLTFTSLYVSIERLAGFITENTTATYALMPCDISTSAIVYAGRNLFRFAFVADADFTPDASLHVREITTFPFVANDPDAGTAPATCIAGTLYAAYVELDAYNTTISLAFPDPFVLFATINGAPFYRLESPHLDWSYATPQGDEIAAFNVSAKASRPLPNTYYFALSRGFAPLPINDSSKTGLAYVLDRYVYLQAQYEEQFTGGPPSRMTVEVLGAGRMHLTYSILAPDLAVALLVEFKDYATGEVLDSVSTLVEGRTIIDVFSNIAFEELKAINIIATLTYDRGYVFTDTLSAYLIIYYQAEDALRSTQRYVGPAQDASTVTGERWYLQDGDALLVATGSAVHLFYAGELMLSWYDAVLAVPSDWSVTDGYTPVAQAAVFKDLGGGVVGFAHAGMRTLRIDTVAKTIEVAALDQSERLIRGTSMPYGGDYRGSGTVWTADFAPERRGFMRVFNDRVNMEIGT
jgi:hypothetical protein